MVESNNEMVEAIEEGKIVRVSRSYAVREGLLILKRQDLPKALNQDEQHAPYVRYKSERKFVDLDRYRKPLRVSDEITASLVDNFGWLIVSKRRERNMSRKQLADAVHAIEDDIKMIELGRLPKNDYVLINKIENFFGIMLRRDPSSGKIDLTPKEHRESRFLKEQKDRSKEKEKADNANAPANDIEIIDEVD